MKLDINTIGYMNVFEKVTGARLKECCVEEDKIIFVVKNGFGRKAIGRRGANVKKLSSMFKKKIKIIEFNEDPKIFVKGAIYPVKAEEITLEENVINVKARDYNSKAMLLGRNRKNLKSLQNLLNKYFKIEIKVL